MNKPIAGIREVYQMIVKQWLPQSMTWKEVVADEYRSYLEARDAAMDLNDTNCEAFVRNGLNCQ